jgi:hypothetical protein
MSNSVISTEVWDSVIERLPGPTEEGVELFKQLYFTRFGVELASKEALQLAIQTIQLVAMTHLYDFIIEQSAKSK